MDTTENILLFIKARVESTLPGAKVYLFGSRAYGSPTEESDWDILILTNEKVTYSIKDDIHAALFPLSVKICSFINTVIAEENDWLNNPSYYALQQTIKGRMVRA